MFDWLIASIPILTFGFIPVIAARVGGKASEQAAGISIGSFVFAFTLMFFRQPNFDTQSLTISFISGVFWVTGSFTQFKSMEYLGVSKSMPISACGQIVGTSLAGVCMGDWSSTISKIYGFSALLFIIIGIIFTSYKEVNDKKLNWKKGIIYNIISSVGFTAYISILRAYGISGWDSILPQSIGQIAGICIISLLLFRSLPFSRSAIKNSVTGLSWGVGNISLMIAQASLGLAVAYPVSQASVIISIIGGVLINHESKNLKEWLSATLGMLFIVFGLILIYMST
ncbi:MAG: GRP family sugar transporter [Culturomica sp.]|jgi:glucose uptake protein|nr:GRP family sugar transporter [Culturomica sp.]